jgi:hypothetical protein
MREMRNAYKIFAEKPEEEITGRPRFIGMKNIY